MAARKNKLHTEEVKQRIQASQLINRLQANALAEQEFMTTGQIKSAEALLDRVIPKMKAVEHSGEIGVTVYRKTIYEAPPGSD